MTMDHVPTDASYQGALAALAAMTQELAELRDELNETNTGVVALYAELDNQAEQLRQASERSESKFHTIYSQAPSGIVLLGNDGTVLGANPAMLKLLQRDIAEVIGNKLSAFSLAQWAAQLDGFSLHRGAEAQSQEVPIQLPSGGLVHLEWSVPSQIEPGIAMVLATDISERVALEFQRLQLFDSERVARGEAEQISRMKDDFIAVLSHELRTPLNAIMGWAHVLLKRGGSDETMRGLAVIKRNGTTQARMISDLLDMSRLNLGKLPLSMSMLDPAQEIDAAISAMMPALEDKEIHLDVILEAPRYRPIQADAARLQQVVWNLLSNAIKFSPRASTISVSLVEVAAGLRILVTDAGQGIAPDFLPFVFDRFAQSDAASNRHRGGLGLGLSIAKQLVEAHGGLLSVRSEGLGHGATFEVWLPTDSGDDAAPFLNTIDDELNVSTGRDERPLRQLKILIVDDDPDATAMLHIILGDRGATLRTASRVDQALEMVGSFRPDVLISDIGMVGQDGYRVICWPAFASHRADLVRARQRPPSGHRCGL
jgi:PAS domain S-box-containing protein